MIGGLGFYAAYWLAVDLTFRLSGQGADIFGVDIALAIEQQGALQTLAFYSGSLLVIAAFVMLVFRLRQAVWVYAAAFPPIVTDWALMTDLTAFQDFLIGYPVMICYLLAFTPLYAMWRLGDFRPVTAEIENAE